MAMTIQQFKAQYPAYKDVDDVVLADKFHSKYYSHIDKGDFYKLVGIEAPSALQSAYTGIKQGATFNLADEIQAGIGALTAAPFVQDRTIGQLYDEGLQQQRQQEALGREVNPVSSAAGEIIGSIPTTAKLIAGLPSKAIMAKTAGESALKAGGVGAGIGAGYGFGMGEGGLENRLQSSAIGGALGGLTGSALDYGISKATGRFKPTDLGKLYSEEGAIPLTQGQLTGERDVLTKEFDLKRGTTKGGKKLLEFENEIQKPAVIDYLRKNFNLTDDQINNPSYQTLISDVLETAQKQAKGQKDVAVGLRNKAEKELNTGIFKQYTDEILADIENAMYKFDVNDANQTLANVRRNLRYSDNLSNLPTNRALSPQEVAYGAKQQPKPLEAQKLTDIQGLFNARKALSKQANAVGAKSAAASEANSIIDKKLAEFIDKGIVSGNTSALEAFKKSVPEFRKYYTTYENSPSNIFNDVITNPQKYSPDEVFNAAFGKTLGGSQRGRLFVEQIKRTQGAEGIDKLQKGFIDNLITKSINPNGDISLQTLKRNLGNFLSNKSFAESVMTPDKLGSLRKLQADLAKATRQPQLYKDSGTAYNLDRIIKGGLASKDPTGLISYFVDKAKQGRADTRSLAEAQRAISGEQILTAKPIFGGIPQNINKPQLPLKINIPK